jgi:uncharacterized protein
VKILLDKIDEEGLDVDEPVTSTWLRQVLGADFNYQPTRDGRLRVRLSRVDDVVTVQGKAVLDLVAPCSRCLRPVPVALTTPLQVTMVPREQEPKSTEDGELSDDDVGISTYENREIDLARVVRDEVFLELPMQALCSDDCLGLCASCGKNLNEDACGCASQKTDERWSALARIKLT